MNSARRIAKEEGALKRRKIDSETDPSDGNGAELVDSVRGISREWRAGQDGNEDVLFENICDALYDTSSLYSSFGMDDEISSFESLRSRFADGVSDRLRTIFEVDPGNRR